tara:strand:+ start:792 stop:899 length:108 start_codon:yes stop_codon:yes gene_type:complete
MKIMRAYKNRLYPTPEQKVRAGLDLMARHWKLDDA